MSIGIHGQNLIFLISQPRAGSTLLQRMLGSHPDIHATSEPWLMLCPLYLLREKGFEGEDNDFTSVADGIQSFLGTLPEGEKIYREALRRAFAFFYDRALAGTGKTFFLDKTPRYYFIIPELYRVFPKAKYIFLLRNPLAVLTSMLDTWVRYNPFRLYHYRHDLLTAPSSIIEGIELLKSNAIVIRYEELVKEPERVLRQLCNQLEITYHPEMVEYGQHQLPRWPYGDQKTVYQHTRPIPELAEKWKETLSRSYMWQQWARAYLQSLGPDVITNMGYSYKELKQILSSVHAHWGITLVSWHSAIKPSTSRTFLERLWFKTFQTMRRVWRAIQHHGIWGTLHQVLQKLAQKS